MAKVIFGNGVSEISGKIAGNVFSRNANGAFIRNRVNPTNPKTGRQISVRASLSTVSSAWRGLTDAQRQAWTDAAPLFPYQDRLGQTKTYTGQQLYCRLNQTIVQVGGTMINTPPLSQEFPGTEFAGITGITLDAGAIDEFLLDFTDTTMPDNWRIQMFATPGVSTGITRPAQGLFKLVTTISTITASQYDAATAYSALFGTPADGSAVWVRLLMVNYFTGQRIELGTKSAIAAE